MLKRRKKIKDYLASKVILFFFFIIVLFLMSKAIKMVKKTNEIKEYLRSSEKEYADLEKRYLEVYDDLEYINSNTGKEKEIRSKFDLSKEGEKVVFIIEEEVISAPPPEPSKWWQKAFDWVSF